MSSRERTEYSGNLEPDKWQVKTFGSLWGENQARTGAQSYRERSCEAVRRHTSPLQTETWKRATDGNGNFHTTIIEASATFSSILHTFLH